jgi:metallo-beta-lactamase class B
MSFAHQKEQITTSSSSETHLSLVKDSIVYQTENLTIQKLTNHTYIHTSFLDTEKYGKVSCNGMIVINNKEAVVFDTPVDNKSSRELRNYVQKKLKSKIKAVIPTHFHEDCLGGLKKFNQHDIPCYASHKTLALLDLKGSKFIKFINGFDDNLTLKVGDKKVTAEYFGEGHTTDNIIGYFSDDNVLFGGCLIKGINSGKGNLEDANVKTWSETVEKIKKKFPNTTLVIPGHGKSGGTELLDYTIKLFH